MTEEEYCELNHVIVRPSDELPASVGGACYHDEEGTEYILINVRRCPDKQRMSLAHELRHIQRGDGWTAAYNEYGGKGARMS